MQLVEYENGDGKFLLYPNDAISMHLMRGDAWEPHFKTIVSSLLPKNLLAIDCGANFGYNSVIMGRMMTEGKLVCFEPQKTIYEQLIKNLLLNKITNFECHQKCLGDRSRTGVSLNPVDYSSSWVNIGDTSVGSGGESVDMISIDELNLGIVGFIKLDVQGYELFVLSGAVETIRRDMPTIFIELEPHQLQKFNIDVGSVLSYLKELGYTIFNIDCGNYKDDYICVKDKASIHDLMDKLILREV
jgi:FkbM family methyltransferase